LANSLLRARAAAERYLSTPLFAPILPDMNEEELKISKSTPFAQLPPPPPPA